MEFYAVLGKVHEGEYFSFRRKVWDPHECIFFCKGKILLLVDGDAIEWMPKAEDILADDWE